MKQSLDLDTFAKTLTDKGYDGYFQTEAAYADKIKDSISRFLRLVITEWINRCCPTS